jgi:hypothetical protein
MLSGDAIAAAAAFWTSGTLWGDGGVQGTAAGDDAVRALNATPIVRGTDTEGDTIVWGTSSPGEDDNIVWGTADAVEDTLWSAPVSRPARVTAVVDASLR